MPVKFIDLPQELLDLVAEEVGGRNLRRNVSNLTICRKWYDASHAVYLTGLDHSETRIHGCDLGHFNERWSHLEQRKLMHRNTRNLDVRLLGHWWDEASKRAIIDGSEGEEDNAAPAEVVGQEGQKALNRWQADVLRPCLAKLFRDLSHFQVLEIMSLETVFDVAEARGPQWPYLYSSAAASFLRCLPLTQDLKKLTLDLCSGLNYDEVEDAHICEEMARILPRIENVRLRLRIICPSIFEFSNHPEPRDIRLRSLVIKLHLPTFDHSVQLSSTCCTETQGSSTLHKDMAKAAARYLFNIADLHRQHASPRHSSRPHDMELLRISYVSAGACIVVADCLTKRRLGVPEEFFAYEDDGWPCWFEHNDERLMDYGPL
ncbi:hypothetical protein LTR37_010966 [Vermiconidia calcicola]|uniref:Uncharacterized protein n=1 Tax=Vermiconidia calcicola TaxID=1690605 RepID=A0ACC3N3T0_9PEZI|nr:hypothetical protein LTR37_010966 [Vermiconidia calcicola]